MVKSAAKTAAAAKANDARSNSAGTSPSSSLDNDDSKDATYEP